MTIRGYVQIVEAFRQHTGARLDRITPRCGRRIRDRVNDLALGKPFVVVRITMKSGSCWKLLLRDRATVSRSMLDGAGMKRLSKAVRA